MRRLHLQQRGPRREVERRRAHGAPDQVLHEVLHRLDEARHLAELEADHLVLEELLAEGLAAEGVAVAVFEGDAGEAEGGDADPEALVCEGLREELCVSERDLITSLLFPFALCMLRLRYLLDMIISKPCPSLPRIFSTGTMTLSRSMNVEPLELTPELYIFFRWIPGVFISNMNAVSPLWPGPPVRAIQSAWVASWPWVIHFFWPFITKCLPSFVFTASVVRPATSDPAAERNFTSAYT